MMKIKELLNQHNNDLRVTYECEHCGYETLKNQPGTRDAYAYNDAYFWKEVIPYLTCPDCGNNRKGEKNNHAIPY